MTKDKIKRSRSFDELWENEFKANLDSKILFSLASKETLICIIEALAFCLINYKVRNTDLVRWEKCTSLSLLSIFSIFFSLPSLSTHHSVILLSLLSYSLLPLHALSFSSMLILSLFISFFQVCLLDFFSLYVLSISTLFILSLCQNSRICNVHTQAVFI